jgi:2-methylcitrate dehydratase PrpD
MTVTSTLIETCARRLPRRVGVDAIAVARHCLLDSLAVAYAAYGEPPIDMLRAVAVEGSASDEATSIAYGDRARAADAALVNGMMVSLQLFDDNQEQMRGHPSAPLWPAVLAVAETRNSTLMHALRAFVIGYEVECRLGLVLNPSHYEMGWHATATQGTFAATIASCLLLALDDNATAHALGIAASMASGIRRNFGTMTMSLHSGLAASNGVHAAQLAAQGFTADPHVFDGRMGIGEVFSREWSDDALARNLDSWGEPFMIVDPGATFKLFPCGRPTLFGVDCALALRRKRDFDASEVHRIVCDVSYMYPRTLIHSRPANGLQAKTSLEYCVATALLNGRPTLTDFTDGAVRRPEIVALIERTEVRVPPELSENIPAVRKHPFAQPVTVTVETQDGHVYSETVHYHKGSPENPATDEDLRQKFIDCARPHIDAGRIAILLQCVQNDDASVRRLMSLLSCRGNHRC